MKVTLVIKSETPDSAIAIAKHKLCILPNDGNQPKVTTFDKLMKHCFVEVEATMGTITCLNNWFCETDYADKPPYKIGTLLHWGSRDIVE